MQYKRFIIGSAIILVASQAHAQIPRPPESIRIPVMAFDTPLTSKASTVEKKSLPTSFNVNGMDISVGKTKLNQVTQAFKTGNPLYNGVGYYLCYSLPKYNHQLWFVSKGVELDATISEIAVKLGDTLPTEYCPLITSSTYPIFNNKMSLGANPEYLRLILGKPLRRQRTTDVYLFQGPDNKKLKLQTQRGRKGVEMIKLTEQK